MHKALDRICTHIEKQGSILKRTVKNWYPNNWREIITFGEDNKVFETVGKKLRIPVSPGLLYTDPTPREEPKVDLHGADVVIDEIPPLEVPEPPTTIPELAAQLIEILNNQERWMSEISLTLKDCMSFGQFHTQMNNRMNDLEVKFNDVKDAVAGGLTAKGPEVTTAPLVPDTPKERKFVTETRKALGSGVDLVLLGYKESTGNYWVSLKEEHRNLKMFDEIKGRLNGLGYIAIPKNFFFLKKTRK